jgi:hypothetical protein
MDKTNELRRCAKRIFVHIYNNQWGKEICRLGDKDLIDFCLENSKFDATFALEEVIAGCRSCELMRYLIAERGADVRIGLLAAIRFRSLEDMRFLFTVGGSPNTAIAILSLLDCKEERNRFLLNTAVQHGGSIEVLRRPIPNEYWPYDKPTHTYDQRRRTCRECGHLFADKRK